MASFPPQSSVRRWAQDKGIPEAGDNDDLTAFLHQRSFDYLFSIVNITYYDALLHASLELPRQCAINYHDALLPRYAGFYPTSWALMHGEKTHGVTWHVITELIDAGDILQQATVDIAADDTAFTLNAKCYDAAIRSFAELIENLSNGAASARPQDLRQRIFTSFYQRPAAGCTLSWDQNAQTLAAFVRALDFGPYANPLGLPKLVVGTEVFLVPQLDVLDTVCTAPAGTVTAIEPTALRVATRDYDVAMRRILSIDGQPLALLDLAARSGLRVGDRLTTLEPA